MKNWIDYYPLPRRRSFIEEINIPDEIFINRPTRRIWIEDDELKPSFDLI